MPGRLNADIVRLLSISDNTYITVQSSGDFRTYSINNSTKYLDIELPPMTALKISTNQPVQLTLIVMNTVQVTYLPNPQYKTIAIAMKLSFHTN